MRLLILALVAAGIWAQQEIPGQVFRTTVNVVVAPVTVEDGDRAYVHGLQPHEFRLTDNGAIQNIKVDVSYIPISLVVAVQANVDTEAVRPKIQKIHSMLAPLVAGDQGEIAVVAFDHRIDVLQDFTTDADLIARAFEKIGKRSGSSTSALNDAVRASIRMLARRPADRRRVLLIISEARDKGSESKAKDVMVDAQLQNVLIESVNISRLLTTLTRKPDPPRPDPIPPTARPQPAGVPPTSAATGTYSGGVNFMPLFVEIFKQTKAIFVDNPLEVYTRYTGGREHSFTTQAGLENAISRIGEELHNQYIIAYNPNNKADGGFHEIKVEVIRNGKIRSDYKIVTRPGYWMASLGG